MQSPFLKGKSQVKFNTYMFRMRIFRSKCLFKPTSLCLFPVTYDSQYISLNNIIRYASNFPFSLLSNVNLTNCYSQSPFHNHNFCCSILYLDKFSGSLLSLYNFFFNYNYQVQINHFIEYVGLLIEDKGSWPLVLLVFIL